MPGTNPVANRAQHGYPEPVEAEPGGGTVLVARNDVVLGPATTLSIDKANLTVGLAAGVADISPSLPWLDPRDYAAPGDGTDIGFALQRAYSSAVGFPPGLVQQFGGMIWQFPGSPTWDDAVSWSNPNVTDLELKGQGAAGLITVKNATGVNVKLLCTGDNGFRAYYHDLSFVSGQAGSDCQGVFELEVAAAHTLERVNFYGIQADVTGLGVVLLGGGELIVHECLFSGCAVVPSVGALANVGILQIRGGVFGVNVERTKWVSASSLRGAAPPFKAQGAGSWNILVTGDQSTSRGARVVLRLLEMSWNVGGCIRFDPDSGFNVAPLSYIDNARIDACHFSDSAAIGGVAVYARKTGDLGVYRSVWRLNAGSDIVALQFDDICQRLTMEGCDIYFGWKVVANNATGYQSLRFLQMNGGVYFLDHSPYVELRGVTAGQSFDPLPGGAGFLQPPTIPLGTAVSLGSGIAQVDLVGVLCPLAGPGANNNGHPDNAGSNYILTQAASTSLEACQAALVDLQGGIAETEVGGIRSKVSLDLTGSVERRQVDTEVIASMLAVPGAGGTQDLSFFVDPGVELFFDLDVQAVDSSGLSTNSFGQRVVGRFELGDPATLGTGAQARALPPGTGADFNPSPDYDLNLSADTAFGATTATLVALAGATSNKVALRVTNNKATAQDFRVRGSVRRTWPRFDPATWAPNYQKLLGTGAGIVIEFGDDTSLPNVGDGNPESSWLGRTQRIDLTQAVGAQKPIYHVGLSPAALPGVTFGAGPPAQNLSVDLSVALGQPGFTLINGTMWIVCQISAGGQALISLSDGVSTPHACALQVLAGHWTMLRDQGLGLGAQSFQADDTAYHTIIGTFFQGRAQIYVDGVTGSADTTAWTPAAQLKVLTLADFVPGGAGGGGEGGFSVSAWGVTNQALPDPGIGPGGAVPANSLVGKLQAFLKARYLTP